MIYQFSNEVIKFGFSAKGSGVHSSRTIMVNEFMILLNSKPEARNIIEFQNAIIDDNVLLKKTSATRKESYIRLRTLYSLNPNVIIFRALRDLWLTNKESLP